MCRSLEIFFKKLKVFCLVFLIGSVLSFCTPSACYAGSVSATIGAPESERTYLVRESELLSLQNDLTRLRQDKETSQKALTSLSEKLKMSTEKLAECEKLLEKQTAELTKLKEASGTQETSLTMLNQSFETFSKEERSRRLRIKAQRNGWEAASAILAIVAACR